MFDGTGARPLLDKVTVQSIHSLGLHIHPLHSFVLPAMLLITVSFEHADGVQKDLPTQPILFQCPRECTLTITPTGRLRLMMLTFPTHFTKKKLTNKNAHGTPFFPFFSISICNVYFSDVYQYHPQSPSYRALTGENSCQHPPPKKPTSLNNGLTSVTRIISATPHLPQNTYCVIMLTGKQPSTPGDYNPL